MVKSKNEIFEAAKEAKLWAGNLIKGKQSQQQNSDKIENRTPIDNSLIGFIANGTEDDVSLAVSTARASFESGEWSKLPPAQRKEIMLRWASLIKEYAEELAALDCVDAGKPITECLNTDIPATLEAFYYYAEAIDKVFGKVAPTGDEALGVIIKEPIGVVGVVLPWNFPAQMFAWKVAPALAAGNAVIAKPSELTSLSAYRLVELAYEAGIPEGTLSLVCGFGETVGKAIGLHNDVDMVSFTGSTEVGRAFLTYAAESNLKEIVLECGGKSPQIIFDDVNLDEIVPSILAASFWNMSENCSCGSRILVHADIKNQLLERLIKGLDNWKLGNPLDEDVTLGPMVEENHFLKVKSFIEDSKSEGAKLISGGNALENYGSGWYVEPTIFDEVTPDMRLFKEEVFGPVVAVTSFQTEEQAIQLANQSNYGLASSVYTNDIKRAIRVARAIKAGTVSVNGFSEGDITAPFGGFKQSGFGGRDKGLEALDQYVQIKTIWIMS